MSRMLKALRQLESTQRLVAPVATSPAISDDSADESVVAVAQSVAVKTPPPIVPVTTTQLSTEDSFEPAFTSWKELAEPYDVFQGLTFGDFLGDSDAKVQTREVADAVAPPPAPIAIATTEIVQMPPVELPTEVSATVEIPDDPTFGNELTPEPSTLVEMELDVDESDEAVIERVSEALDLTDSLTKSVAEEIVDDVVAEELISADTDTESAVAEELVSDAPLETPALPASDIDDVLVESLVEPPEIDHPISEPLAVVEDANAVLEQPIDSVVDELAEEPLADVIPEPATPEVDDAVIEAEASDDNQLNWGDLFPGGELDGELSDSGEHDVDALVESLGHFDVDGLVANAPTPTAEIDDAVSTPDDQLDEAPAPKLPVEPEEDFAANGYLKLHDEAPVPKATPETEYVAPAPSAEDRPELSPAETAALTDLSNDVLLKQYNTLADRIRRDLAKGEYRCAALIGAEHQPHVTETILRTAIAVGLGKAQHVLMVDASLNDKHLTAGLNLTVELGLTEVLKGRVPWQQVVRATATPGVCVLPAGRLPPPKLDDNDDSLKLLLKELTSQWDLVLLDAGNCKEPSAKSIMAAARNVYLLARLGETETTAAAAAVAAIADSGAKNRGCVVTNA